MRAWLEQKARQGQHLEQWLSRRSFLVVLVVLAVALGFRFYLGTHLDLRGAPGAGAIQRLALVSVGDVSHWDSRLVGLLLPLVEGDVLSAGRVAGALGGALGALGALLCAWALGGPIAGLAVGLLAGVWARGVFITLTYGMEGPAWGIAWLGVGLVWIGAVTRRWWGLGLVVAGAAVAMLGTAVKGTALPALGYLVLAPFLVRTSRTMAAVVAGVLVATTWWCRNQFFADSVPPLPSGNLEISIAAVVDGLRSLAAQPDSKPLGWLPEIAVLGVLGAVLPGAGWWRRVLVGAGSAVVVGLTVNHLLTGDHLGPMLRMRYLVPPILGPLVLFGCAVAWGVRRWGTFVDTLLFRREPTGSSVVGWLAAALHAAGLLGVFLPAWVGALDAMALCRAWGNQRSILEGAKPPTVPVPPGLWTDRYSRLGTGSFFNTSAIGGIDLFELGKEGPDAGVAIVPLRDEREGHLTLSANLQRIPSWVLHPRHCCDLETATATCAAQVVADIDVGGVLLVLPRLGADPRGRVDGRLLPWTRWLLAAAESRGTVEGDSQWWATFQGRGDSPPNVCGWTGDQRFSGARRGGPGAGGVLSGQ